MNKGIIPILLLLFCSLIAQRVCAQDSLIVIGHIQETFFKRGMKDCHLQIFTADSMKLKLTEPKIFKSTTTVAFSIYTPWLRPATTCCVHRRRGMPMCGNLSLCVRARGW